MQAITSTDLFDVFRRDWAAALDPCVSCLLAQCPAGEREALRLLLDDFLMTAPSPPYSPVQMRRQRERLQPILDRLAADPDHQAVLRALDDQNAARYRDLPRWRRKYNRLRLRAMEFRYGLRGPMRFVNRLRPAPWD